MDQGKQKQIFRITFNVIFCPFNCWIESYFNCMHKKSDLGWQCEHCLGGQWL